MADGDEEDFVAIGTQFEQLEEDAPRKKPVPIHEQVVTDSRGRRRFHGAFTGGFSAGYFNTVDTEEGWAPKTFVSSRSQKGPNQATQRPEDFMDEEDLSEFGIAPKRVVTTEKFQPAQNVESERKRTTTSVNRGTAGVITGDRILEDLVIPVKMSVGIKLLSQMGWKEGQGVGPRVRRAAKKTYGCPRPPNHDRIDKEDDDDIYAVGLLFAPKDVNDVEFTAKDNFHGIGYSGINPRTALLGQNNWLGMEPATQSIGIRGQGFGVGALEEDDDDIYGHDSLSNYDISLSTSKSNKKKDFHGWTGPPQSSDQGGLLSLFAMATKRPPTRKLYAPPVVPRDFNPVHKPDKEDIQTAAHPINKEQSVGRSTKENSRARLTAKERGEALGETPLSVPKKSIFDYIADEDKTRLKESREKAREKARETSRIPANAPKRFVPSGSHSGFQPFASDPDKQARYDLYVTGVNTAELPLLQGSKMTEWERECESEEFARSAALYRPLSQTMAARFTTAKQSDETPTVVNESATKDQTSAAASMKMFGALTRERLQWYPDKLLCKRFNIPNPYPGAGTVGVPRHHHETKLFDEPIHPPVQAIEYQARAASDTHSHPTEQEKAELTEKPSALVAGFQSIAAQKKQQVSSTPQTANEGQQTGIKELESGENVITRAPMDLFKAVFAESSSESDSEKSDSEESVEEEIADLAKKNASRDSTNDLNEKFNGKGEGKVQSTIGKEIDDSSVPVRENVVEPSVRRPSPEVFGPALPSSSGRHSATARSVVGATNRDELHSKKPKQKHKKKKHKTKKGKETDSDVEYTRQRKGRKETRTDDSDSELTERHRKKTKKSDRKRHKNKLRDKDFIEYKHEDYLEKCGKEKRDENPGKSHSAGKNFRDKHDERISLSQEKKRDETRESRLSSRDREQSAKEPNTNRVPETKEILDKLKNIQLLKERKRMRATDFM